MRIVMTRICNSLMAVAIQDMLRRNDNFLVYQLDHVTSRITSQCIKNHAEVVLLEVAYNFGFTMEEQLDEARELRKVLPECKILLLCDDNSTPELARKVVKAKKDRLIDDFVYSSVSESYLTALLYAI